jgi:hypothetical protein
LRISPGGSLSSEYDDDDDEDEEEEEDYSSESDHGNDDDDNDEARRVQQHQQYDDEDDNEDGSLTNLQDLPTPSDRPVTLRILTFLGNAVVETTRGVSRAIKAGINAVRFDPVSHEDSSSDGGTNPLKKTFHVLSCMVKAALDKNYAMYDWNKVSQKSLNKRKKGKKHNDDITQYLCQAYGVHPSDNDSMDPSQSHVTFMGGSLSDALSKARAQARLLVIYIPSSKPRNDRKKQKHDTMAIQSLLSRKVFQVAEKSAISNRSKDDSSSQSQMPMQRDGSFAFWSTKYDSKEKISAMKRLKVKPLGNSSKNPILMVVYPYAAPTLNALGQVQIVPRVLAQHHCNPPPGEESMAKWLNSLRKRYKKQYAKMQHDLMELELFKERERGYQSSIEDDRLREEKEREKRRIEAEREKAEKQRQQEILQRRKELQDSLAEEPDKDKEGVVTVAVRFSDGGRGQRRFDGEDLLDQVFNWIDVAFEIERETFDLVTMNGKKSFTYGQQEDLCLKDAGMGKMFALRVIKKEQKDINEEDSSIG